MTKILLVDDRESNLLALRASLSAPGREFVCVRSGADAISAVRSVAFAVAVLDVMMPGMDGIATAKVIRALQPHLPLVFVTALGADPVILRSVRKLGGAEYFVKPVDPAVLSARVDEFVSLYSAAGVTARS